jgi:hypothetical protein
MEDEISGEAHSWNEITYRLVILILESMCPFLVANQFKKTPDRPTFTMVFAKKWRMPWLDELSVGAH